jgi:hypothetical protein
MSTELAGHAATLLQQARRQIGALIDAEQAIRDDLQQLCHRTWDLGKSLAELKEIVGHGKWMFFVANNFPELGDTEPTRVRRANDSKAFFEANPNYPVSGNFTVESIRKCVFHLAPDKERPQLTGDQPIAPHAHPLTFVNQFLKWDRQAEIGLVARPPVDVFRRDIEPVIRRIVELGGKDWVESIL